MPGPLVGKLLAGYPLGILSRNMVRGFCLSLVLIILIGGNVHPSFGEGRARDAASLAVDEEAKTFGQEYMQVDKKKMKHRRRIIIKGE
jgi:hypothetical protein